MSKTDEAIRIKAIAVLDAAEVGVGALSNIFRELATGVPIDPQRAENLAAQCAELQKTIVDARRDLATNPGGLSEAEWHELSAAPQEHDGD
jgi:hypothetical protein